ncbi:MAG TPA: hypothetical protein P5555_09850 [Candidatus Paceibacterota bacterium]|nr:hypothetical protein [Verrucomicrobiota bacterium]HRZ45480.1 hypothetical protein [Candidatus Paceibacterota bacterium]
MEHHGFAGSRWSLSAGRRRGGMAVWVLAAGLVLAAIGGSMRVAAQTDNFDDGNDDGWTRYDREGTAAFSLTGGVYRIQASSSAPTGEQDKAQVVTYRSQEYTDFYAAVDLTAWDNQANSAIGIAFRMQDVGPGTTVGYVLYWTPAISGGGNRVFSIYFMYQDQPMAAVAATYLTLDPARQYRMVVTGVGNQLVAQMYDLTDLTRPVAYIAGEDNYLAIVGKPMRGKCGLFAYSRNNMTVDVTFDNYVAAASGPVSVPAPATPHPVAGTPQVVNRVPVSNQNFHPAGSGITFTATTFGGGAIDPAEIQLFLNGADVSGGLDISGNASSRSVAYRLLSANEVYDARIVLKEQGGKASTNDFCFDTFSEDYITSTNVMLVECEDYNYGKGQYQNRPVPSGFDLYGTQVNGGGVGYLDQVGEPGVDCFDRRTGGESGYMMYRKDDAVGTFAGSLYYQWVNAGGFMATEATNDTPLLKFTSLGLPDYQVHHTEGGEWLNYTREFVPGRYRVYLRLSSWAPQDVWLDEVTSDRTQTNQTTAPLGRFAVANTGHLILYRYFALADESGNPKSIPLSGEKTLRLTMGGPQMDFTRNALQMNYLLFVPAPLSPVKLLDPAWSDGVFTVSFASEAGAIYRLSYKDSLSQTNWAVGGSSVVGDGSIQSLSDASAAQTRFYRVSAE